VADLDEHESALVDDDDDCPVPLELNGKTIAWAVLALIGSLAVFIKVYGRC